jgi:hypothetical protein
MSLCGNPGESGSKKLNKKSLRSDFQETDTLFFYMPVTTECCQIRRREKKEDKPEAALPPVVS